MILIFIFPKTKNVLSTKKNNIKSFWFVILNIRNRKIEPAKGKPVDIFGKWFTSSFGSYINFHRFSAASKQLSVGKQIKRGAGVVGGKNNACVGGVVGPRWTHHHHLSPLEPRWLHEHLLYRELNHNRTSFYNTPCEYKCVNHMWFKCTEQIHRNKARTKDQVEKIIGLGASTKIVNVYMFVFVRECICLCVCIHDICLKASQKWV